MPDHMPLLKVRDLQTSFFTPAGEVKAVNGVSFNLERGKVLGIVGESGSGKSVTAYSIMQILASTGKIVGGSIKLDGQELVGAGEKVMKTVRGNKISIIFQDPMTSLNPTYTIGHQLMEAILLHTDRNRKQAWDRAVEMLRLVNVNEPEKRMKQYPFEFSGGMRQRVMIAMAIINRPTILIADEPTTALDVTIQAQILDIMRRLKGSSGSLMLITHNLGIVAGICEEVVVMYAGRAIERGTLKAIFDNPLHPYTQGLMASVPTMRSEKKPLYTIPGTVPTVYDFKEGCRFADRCQHCTEECRTKIPPVKRVGEDHIVQCWMNFEGEEPYHE